MNLNDLYISLLFTFFSTKSEEHSQ